MQVHKYITLHEDPLFIYAIPGKDRNPTVKKKKPIVPVWPLHFLPTSSEDSTSEQVPIMALPKPETNLKTEYIHILVERAESNPEIDMTMHDKTMVFFLPNDESANDTKRNPPTRVPK